MVATTEGGGRVELTFPPGAVRVPTDVTVRPLPAAAGNWLTVALEPAGMVFLQPFAVAATVPDDANITDAQLFLRPDDPVHVATTVDGRTLRASLRFFGFTEDSTWVVPASPGVGTLPQTGGGNNLGAAPVDCQQIIASTQARFDGFLALGEYERAIEAALDIATLLQQAACSGAEQWAAEAAQIACDQLDAAIQSAQSTPTVTYGDFKRQVQDVIDWVVLAQTLHQNCPSVFTYATVLDAEITDFLSFFEIRLGGLTALDYVTFQNLKEEAVSVFELMVACLTLGLPDGYDLLETKALGPAVDRMRDVAFEMCRDDGWHYPLSRLTATGFFAGRDIYGVTPPRPSTLISGPAPTQYANFSDDDIYTDIQYCAMCLELESMVASGGMLDSTMAGSTGVSGSNTTDVTIDAPTRGSLLLGGRMGAFNCWNDIDGDTELIFALDGTDVLTLRRPVGQRDYLQAGPETVDIAAAAMAAGITPKEGNTHDLTIRRRRTSCDDRLWGDAVFRLATATLQWKNPTLDVEISFPEEVESGQPTPIDIRVGVVDQLDQTGYFADIDVELEVVGGIAAALSGQTDGSGYFHTTVTADGGSLAKGERSAQPTISVTARASSFEGVTAENQRVANVKDEGTVTLLEAIRYIQANAHALEVHDVDRETVYIDGTYNQTRTAFVDKTIAPRTGTVSSNASIASDVVVESGYLTMVTGTHDGTTEANGVNLDTTWGDVAYGGTGVDIQVQFEVHDKPVSYALEVTSSASGNYGGYVRLEGVFDNRNFKPTPPNFTESGMLDPGIYKFVLSALAASHVDGNCGTCSESGTVSASYTLTFGSQNTRR